MVQIRAKQVRLSKPGDIIVADNNNNGSILSFPLIHPNDRVLTISNGVLSYEFPSVLCASDGSAMTSITPQTKLGAASGSETADADANSSFTTKGWVSSKVDNVRREQWIQTFFVRMQPS